MNKNKCYFIIFIIISLTLISLLQTVTAENKDVTLEFFYTNRCTKCDQTKPIIDEIETDYNEEITVIRYLVIKNVTLENFSLFREYYGFQYVPAVVVLNETNTVLFNHTGINKKDIENTIISMLPEIGSDPEDPESKPSDSSEPNVDILTILPFIIIIIILPMVILIIVINKRRYSK